MAEEEVVAVAPSPAPSDNKRKLEDLEPEAPQQVEPSMNEPADSNAELDGGAKHVDVAVSVESDAKRPRRDDKPDGLGILTITRSLSFISVVSEKNFCSMMFGFYMNLMLGRT